MLGKIRDTGLEQQSGDGDRTQDRCPDILWTFGEAIGLFSVTCLWLFDLISSPILILETQMIDITTNLQKWGM